MALQTASSSSPNDAAMPGSFSPSMSEDFKAYQDLLRLMAAILGILAEFLQENTLKVLDILQPSASVKIALPINEALQDFAKALYCEACGEMILHFHARV